jgi:hypothetical protein
VSERYKIVRLKMNPVRVRKKRARVRKKRRAAPARRRRSPAPKRRYAVEVLHQSGHNAHFYFWDGKQLTPNRTRAKTYASEQDALKEARKCMKNRAPAYRLARVVPA